MVASTPRSRSERPERIALVTGAGGGIGAALCRELATHGVAVVATGRRLERVRGLAGELTAAGGRALAVALDVTSGSSVREACEQVRAELGPIDWVVNNAGWVETAPVGRADEAHYQEHLEVNFHGARRVLEAALSDLVANRGAVVQVASSASLRGYAYVTAYTAAKHALLGYSRSAALELARSGVAVNVLCPHYVDSPMTDANVERMRAKTGRSAGELRAFLAQENPGGVLVTTEEVARAAWELLAGGRSGVVLELLGGATRTVDPGFELTSGGPA